MESFDTLGLPRPLMDALVRMNFVTPTPIQAQSIPLALEGRDILGSAQTGTGKTAAFGIPLIARLMNNPRGTALIMTPTRELAVQVMQTLQDLIGKAPIRTATLIGGESMPKQLQQLRMRPRLIVGTPGRINDHLTRGSLMLHDVCFLVLDETDRMLDMGFTVQIDKIMKFISNQHQTLLFSATLPPNIVKISEKYMHNPVRVSVDPVIKPATNITQEIMHVREDEKYQIFLDQLNQREGTIIVFVKTKRGAERMAIRLSKLKHSAEAIHGDLRQSRRDRVIEGFRNRKHRILVATDIAARGLDIPHIEHVINYDLPQCPEDYIHRIGRTARAGAQGSALCLISPADKEKWREIEKLLDPEGQPTDFPRGNHGRRGARDGEASGASRFDKKRRNRRRPNRNRKPSSMAA